MAVAGTVSAAPGAVRGVTRRPRAADEWLRTHDAGQWTVGWNVTATADGGALVVGDAGESDAATRGHLARLSPTGRVDWTRTYDELVHGYAVPAAGDGGHLVVGTTLRDREARPYLIRVDANGETTWERALVVGDESHLFPRAAIRSGDDFLVAGPMFTEVTDLVLTAVGPDGSQRWERRYEIPGEGGQSDLARADDGGYLLTTVYDDGSGSGTLLVRTDDRGREQWRARLEGQFGVGATATGDGRYVLVGAKGSPTSRDAWVGSASEGGSLEWTRTFGGDGREEFVQVVPTDDGVLCAGTTTSLGPEGGRNLYLASVDAAGSLAWERAYGADGPTVRTNSLVPAGDGTRYVVVGDLIEESRSELFVGRFGLPPSDGLAITGSLNTTGEGTPAPGRNGSAGGSSAGRNGSAGGEPAGEPTRTEGDPSPVVPRLDATGLAVAGLLLDAALIAVGWLGYRWYADDSGE